MTSEPTENPALSGDTGRGNNGRFLPGNKIGIGQGNPFAKRVNELRSALYKAITPQDVNDIVKAMIDNAKKGDTPSAKLVLGYVVSQPPDVGGSEEDNKDTVAVVARIPRDKAIALLREHS